MNPEHGKIVMPRWVKPVAWSILGVLMVLLTLSALARGASALSCTVDTSPYIISSSRPVALCVVNDTANADCYTFLSYGNRTWGGLPKNGVLDGVGRVDTFKVANGAVTVEFSTEDLRQNFTVTGNVQCGSEDYTFNFTPQYIDYSEVSDAALTIKDNDAQIVFIILGGIVVLSLVFLIIRWIGA